MFFVLLLWGCYADELEREAAREPFFDLAGYMEREVDSLRGLGLRVEKTVVLNGTEETQTLDELNFATDLRLFREADINKPAWLDKYVVNETTEAARRVRTYTATDSSMQTWQLRVVYGEGGGSPEAIEVYRRTGTVLSDGEHHLRYAPATGYRIRTEQVNRFGDDLDATITVRWE